MHRPAGRRLKVGDFVETTHGWKGVLMDRTTHKFTDSRGILDRHGIDTVQWIVAPEKYVGRLDQIHTTMLNRVDDLV